MSLLDRAHPEFNSNLAGLFVPSVPERYQDSKNKIIIVGRETRAWNIPQRDDRTDLPAYLRASMNKHGAFLVDQIAKPNSKGRAFHNFVRAVAKRSGGDGIVYCNLFCFSWNKSMPRLDSALFKETIGPYSEALLKTQIDYFKPEIIIFANGVTPASVRRQFFPVDGVVCSNMRHYEEGYPESISRKRLWEFTLYDTIRCLRINHPSSLSKVDARARQFLLSLLPPTPVGSVA